jgi:hypothetical protein
MFYESASFSLELPEHKKVVMIRPHFTHKKRMTALEESLS